MIHFRSIANKSFWGTGDGTTHNTYPNGVASCLRTTANGGFSIICLCVTVGGGHKLHPQGVGWVAEPWPRPKLPPPPSRGGVH